MWETYLLLTKETTTTKVRERESEMIMMLMLLPWFQLHPHCGGRGGAEDSSGDHTQHWHRSKFSHVVHLSFTYVLTLSLKEMWL